MLSKNFDRMMVAERGKKKIVVSYQTTGVSAVSLMTVPGAVTECCRGD